MIDENQASSKWVGIARAASVLSVILAAVGCREHPPPGEVTDLGRDSAGIRIVDNPVALWRAGEEWRIDSIVTATIGAPGSGTELSKVAQAVVLSDGTIALVEASLGSERGADPGTIGVLRFDSAGGRLPTIGRKGKGPGEFTGYPMLAVSATDTIVTLDMQGL